MKGNGETEQLRALATAMGDPVRSKLLMAVGDSSDGVSIRQIAERVREPQRKVRYHLDALKTQGLVYVADEQKRRGVVERLYKLELPTVIPSHYFERIDEAQARKISLHVLKVILADASAAASAGMFGTRPGHATLRIPATVDEQGWADLAALQERMLERCERIIATSDERLKASQQNPLHVVASFLLFEVPGWPA